MNRLKELKIKVAEKVIKIIHNYNFSYDYCKEYVSNEKEDFFIEIKPQDIEFERERSTIKCSDGYLELLAIHRKISEIMPKYNTILFHGSVLAMDGKAYLFTAPSGTGKSTHTRLWKEYFKERVIVVNDDKPFLKIEGDAVFAYGTPWDGKHRLSSNIKVPLKGICILSQDKENWIRKIDGKSVYPYLYNQVYHILSEKENAIKTLQLFDKLLLNVPIYKMGCNISFEAVETSYFGMIGEEDEIKR